MEVEETRQIVIPVKRFLGVSGSSWLTFWIFYAVILVSATHFPEVKLPDAPHSDKWIHSCAYFVLMSLWCAWSMTWKSPQRGIMAGAVLMLLFGGIDELTQPLFNRHADIWDWCCDVVGIVISGGLCGVVSVFVKSSRDKG